jgi:hypothetical protein
MDTRKRGFRSVPPKRQEYTTKRELAERRSLPLCPPLPAKVNKRTSQKSLFQERGFAKVIFFNQPGENKSFTTSFLSVKDLCL